MLCHARVIAEMGAVKNETLNMSRSEEFKIFMCKNPDLNSKKTFSRERV
jgi:hypothetical protein